MLKERWHLPLEMGERTVILQLLAGQDAGRLATMIKKDLEEKKFPPVVSAEKEKDVGETVANAGH